MLLKNLKRSLRNNAKTLCGSALACGVISSFSPAFAAPEKGTLVFKLENDIFTGSDNQYTNGLAIAWESESLVHHDQDGFARKWSGLFEFLPGFEPDKDRNYLSMILTHDMNTSSDITDPNPPLNEQPYSGILMLDTQLHTDFPTWSQIWRIKVGAVGPITQADHIQTAFHDLIGADEPQGWGTQLPNEPVFNIGYLAGRPLWSSAVDADTKWRISGVTSVDAGTFLTGAGAVLIVELGSALRRPGAASSSDLGYGLALGFDERSERSWDYSVFASTGGYGIARFLPLDGNAFRDSRSIDYEEFIQTFSVGVSGRYKRMVVNFSLNYGATPTNSSDADIDYGALSVGWRF